MTNDHSNTVNINIAKVTTINPVRIIKQLLIIAGMTTDMMANL